MNTNCLEGMRCPKCGQEDEILVQGTSWLSLKDEGSDFYAASTKGISDVEYHDDSLAACPECDYQGELGDFKVKEPAQQQS